MSKVLVSVCLITYRHEKYIRQAIESVLRQKVNFSWEFIIADDCSPDSTRKIIQEYKERYPDLIRLLFQEKNIGAGKNFLNLINTAQGKYIAYLEGDDYWTNDFKLQKQFDFLETRPDYTLCYHKISREYTYYSPDLEKIGIESNINDPLTSTLDDLFAKGWFIRSCSMFFRSIKLPAHFEKLYVGDFPLHVLLADQGKIGFINECLGTYRIHKEGFSEKNLHIIDYDKREKNFRNEIFLNDFLNRNTGMRHNVHFEKRKFDAIYSHLHFVFKNHRRKVIKNGLYVIRKFSLVFLLKHAFLKMTRNLNS